jgi:hypothetical protein
MSTIKDYSSPLAVVKPLDDVLTEEETLLHHEDTPTEIEEEGEDDEPDIVFVHLVSSEKMITMLFSDDDSPFYLCYRPLKVLEIVTPEESLIRFAKWNHFLEDDSLSIHVDDVLYIGQINEEGLQIYLEYLKEIDEEEEKLKKSKEGKHAVLKTEENIVFGNFQKTKIIKEDKE